MRVMELTPELFEKIEFAERRKGYDTEQVETFLEQAGTALAQLLARVRHIEERSAQAEGRLAQADAVLAEADQRAREADARVAQADQRAQQAERVAREAREAAQHATASAATSSRLSEEAEVEQAAKTLLMARRTAEATVNEARGRAQALTEEAQARTERQIAESNAEAEELIRRAGEQADAEYADRKASAIEEVRVLESRRGQLADVISQLEARLAGYRSELTRAADELTALAEDPSRLGARPNMSILPDEVLTSAPVVEDDGPGDDFSAGVADTVVETAERVDVTDTAVEDSGPDDGGAHVEVVDEVQIAEEAAAEPEARAAYLDLTTPSGQADQVGEADRWGPGSWAEVEADLDDAETSNSYARAGARESGAASTPAPRATVDDRPTEAVPRADVPRDRYMEELDSAVNEAVELDDDAMTAFFEGTGDSKSRRFGWRR